MIKLARCYGFGVFVTLIWSAAALGADRFEPARVRIQNVMTAHNIPSVTVAVAHQGKIVWEQGLGWADRDRRIAATPHTLYSLASISKPITATALMVLVERGQVDLDKPIETYLGTAKLTARIGDAGAATVRRVADHTAGLPMHARFFYADEHVAVPALDETIRRYAVLMAPPGEAHVYSNLGYGLLEYAIEQVSGRSYAQFVTDEVFSPLGMRESAIPNGVDVEGAATGYWGDRVVPPNESDTKGSGAVFMSAHDLVRFGMFHLHGQIEGQERTVLSSRALHAMCETRPLNDGSRVDYAVGWAVGRQHGLEYLGHNGGKAGVATVLAIYPAAEAVIVVLANGISRTGAVHFLESDIIHSLLPDTIRADHGFTPPPELVGRWRGHLETDAGRSALALDVQQNGSVFIRLGVSDRQEVIKVRLDPKTGSLELGDIIGRIETSDARRHPGPLQLSLRPRGSDRLTGAIVSNSLETLSDRMGNAVSYWVELRREKDE